MPRRQLSRLLLACGATLVLAAFALAMGGSPGSVSAQPLPPRPTLTPQPPTVVPPTAVPPTVGPTSVAPTPSDSDDDDDGDAAAEPARITGTVIDQRTGAPAPGLSVRVGEALLTTDASGNYDRGGLEAGSYGVALSLTPEQGVAAQGELTVALEAGQTVVQHLFFNSPAPAAPPAATAVPIPSALPATGAPEETWSGLLLLGLLMLGMGVATREAESRR